MRIAKEYKINPYLRYAVTKSIYGLQDFSCLVYQTALSLHFFQRKTSLIYYWMIRFLLNE